MEVGPLEYAASANSAVLPLMYLLLTVAVAGSRWY